MKRRLASPSNEWRDFTEEHRNRRLELIEAINDVNNGVERDPIALVGPYRTGKTQLLYEAFDNAWDENIPALYTDANTIFNEFDQADNINIADWLTDRVSEQVDNLNEGKTADWLPNWNDTRRRKEFINGLDVDVQEDQTAILLVDEIEQAYTRIREGDFVDDDNPLRVILDDPEGVYPVWAFGLVAAYELGPADYARFQELRVPILDVEDIYQQLKKRRPEVNENIAPGIWWLSRGRIGWANKLVDEAPKKSTEIAEWVRDISTQEFEGLTPINNEIWTEGVESKDWDRARRSILFLNGEYEPWEHRDEDAIHIDDAVDLLLKYILDSIDDLSGMAKQLLEKNIDRLAKNLVPMSSRFEDEPVIPATVFTDEPMVEGFIDLLSDLILSFEASTEDRAKLINGLEEIDAAKISSDWTDEFYNHFTEVDLEETWIPDLEVINNAYPPVAVDPSRLTDKTTEDLRDDLTSGISIDPDVATDSIQYEVVFCPTSDILSNHIESALNPTEFSKVYVFFTPENIDDEINHDKLKKLVDLNRVNIITNPESRMWKFVIHLQHYLESEHDITGIIKPSDVRDVIAEEDYRDKRNVISSLFSQLNDIAKSETLSAVRSFEDQFTRESGQNPLWEEPLSGETGPDVTAPGVFGARSERLNALAFSIGVSRFKLTEFSEISSITSTLEKGINDGYVTVSGNKFGYKQFLDSTLTQTGITNELETFWRRFIHQDSGQRDRSVANLQELLRELIQLSDFSEEDIINRIKNTDNDGKNEPSQLDPVKNSTLDTHIKRDFILGVILEDIVVRNSHSLSNSFNSPTKRIDKAREQLEKLHNEIQTLNDKLVPPDDYGESVEIVEEPVNNRDTHLERLSDDTMRFIEFADDNKEFAGIAVSYYSIMDSYLDIYDNEIKNLRTTISETDLFSVKDLKGTFDQSRKIINEENKIYDYTEFNKDEVRTNLEEFANKAFDFEAAQGGGKINPMKEDALANIESHAEENEKVLREFNQKIRQLQREIRSLEEKQENLKISLNEFHEDIQSTVVEE
jgi:hypothetical protein